MLDGVRPVEAASRYLRGRLGAASRSMWHSRPRMMVLEVMPGHVRPAALWSHGAARLARSSSAASCMVSSRSGLHPQRHSMPWTTPKNPQMSGPSS
jgi:hypothetical protein